jgi:hypothetical protein
LPPFGSESSVERSRIVLHLDLHGFETWPFTLREKHRLRVFEGKALRRTFGPKREAGEDCITRSFIIFSLLQILLGRSSEGG